jgi:hypothetical protein
MRKRPWRGGGVAASPIAPQEAQEAPPAHRLAQSSEE